MIKQHKGFIVFKCSEDITVHFAFRNVREHLIATNPIKIPVAVIMSCFWCFPASMPNRLCPHAADNSFLSRRKSQRPLNMSLVRV